MRPEGKTLGLINASALLGPTEGGFFNGTPEVLSRSRTERPDLQRRVDRVYATIGARLDAVDEEFAEQTGDTFRRRIQGGGPDDSPPTFESRVDEGLANGGAFFCP